MNKGFTAFGLLGCLVLSSVASAQVEEQSAGYGSIRCVCSCGNSTKVYDAVVDCDIAYDDTLCFDSLTGLPQRTSGCYRAEVKTISKPPFLPKDEASRCSSVASRSQQFAGGESESAGLCEELLDDLLGQCAEYRAEREAYCERLYEACMTPREPFLPGGFGNRPVTVDPEVRQARCAEQKVECDRATEAIIANCEQTSYTLYGLCFLAIGLN
ncbi:MAG: hypothetical protein KDD66_03950 [Bdellovibrionales bacterium]|nr:hypothetical protein [Bdellovibrionales bacterium]